MPLGSFEFNNVGHPIDARIPLVHIYCSYYLSLCLIYSSYKSKLLRPYTRTLIFLLLVLRFTIDSCEAHYKDYATESGMESTMEWSMFQSACPQLRSKVSQY